MTIRATSIGLTSVSTSLASSSRQQSLGSLYALAHKIFRKLSRIFGSNFGAMMFTEATEFVQVAELVADVHNELHILHLQPYSAYLA